MTSKVVINVDEKLNEKNMQATIIVTLLKENEELKKFNDEVEKKNDVQFNKILSLEKDLETLRKSLKDMFDSYKMAVVRAERLDGLRSNDFKEIELLKYEILKLQGKIN